MRETAAEGQLTVLVRDAGCNQCIRLQRTIRVRDAVRVIKAENEFMQAKISLVKEKEVVATEEGDNGMWHSSLMNAPGEGFLFGLYNADSIAYPDGSLEPDTLIATGITNKDGELTFCGSFPHGEYYARELSAPEGWKLDSARYCVSISL